MKKPVILWAVFEPHGGMIRWCVRPTRRDAVFSFSLGVPETWERARKSGYRVAKVEVREIE